jgi:calcineurin-like phosphoesterase family protein
MAYFNEREARFLKCSQLMGLLERSVRGNFNAVLSPEDSRFLFGLCLQEKNRVSGPRIVERLMGKAVDVAGDYLDNIGRELCDSRK